LSETPALDLRVEARPPAVKTENSETSKTIHFREPEFLWSPSLRNLGFDPFRCGMGLSAEIRPMLRTKSRKKDDVDQVEKRCLRISINGFDFENPTCYTLNATCYMLHATARNSFAVRV